MRRALGMFYLTHDPDTGEDTSWLGTPGSPYGNYVWSVAPVAWRLAYLLARETETEIDEGLLDHAMSLVVNGHDDVRYIIDTYGYRHYW